MNWTYNTIWTEQLPEGSYKHIMFNNSSSSLVSFLDATYFITEDYKPKSKSFEELKGIISPKYLVLNRSNITSFAEIAKLGKVKRLELFHCIKLESDFGISGIENDIKWLHISTSKKFTPNEELFKLRKLKVLCLNDCAPLENLDFLCYFPDLVDFRFVNTNIIDGNLKPLLEHPNLQNVGFLDKRHYNLKRSDLEIYFDKKSINTKEFTHKGEYVTFRYKTINA